MGGRRGGDGDFRNFLIFVFGLNFKPEEWERYRINHLYVYLFVLIYYYTLSAL